MEKKMTDPSVIREDDRSLAEGAAFWGNDVINTSEDACESVMKSTAKGTTGNDSESMPISARILKSSEKIWDGFYSHPFVLGITDGSLDKEKFCFFMIQDYLYLYEYAKVFSVGTAKAGNPEIFKAFAAYVNEIMDGELNIHRGYMKRLGIKLEEAEAAVMAQDNLSYTSYMLRIAYESGPAEICAAILPCAISYEMIAKKMIEVNPECINHPFYGEWVRGYADPAYHEANEALKILTEKAAAGYSEEAIRNLEEIGRRCSLYEMSFWDMSWEMRR